jgi:hypothetical protein
MPKSVSVDELAVRVREEFTTLNILVQALNRELRDEMLTLNREVKQIGRKLGVTPVYGSRSARRASTKRPKGRAASDARHG